jgi:hypothetical protein
MFEGHEVTNQEEGLLAMIQGLPLMYTSLEEHQGEDPFRKDLLEALKRGDPNATRFRLSTERRQNKTICCPGTFAPNVVEIIPRLSYVRAFGLV